MLSITGEDRYVADYLYHEALTHLPDDHQQFLRRTSVLDQLSAPLCDAVLEDRRPEQLRALEARTSSWFRSTVDASGSVTTPCSASSSSVSSAESNPTSSSKLHLRAADWYESNGSPALALEHL